MRVRPTFFPTREPPADSPVLSTSLFDDIWSNALDPSYATAARIRGPGERTRGGVSSGLAIRIRTVLVLVLVGIGTATVITTIRGNAPTANGSRAALVRQVNQGNDRVAELESELAEVRTRVAAAQANRLAQTAEGADVQRMLTTLEGAVGATAVDGPGLVVRLSDPPAGNGDSGSGQGTGARLPPLGPTAATLTDRDLQAVVNALWGAGAEAISVGGHRLGPTSAIRTAGSTILVDFRPVTSPYVISAIGNRDDLETGLAGSTAGRMLQSLKNVYGIGFSTSRSGNLHLPGATLTDPIHALPVTSGGPR